jgi:hypothetical protein
MVASVDQEVPGLDKRTAKYRYLFEFFFADKSKLEWKGMNQNRYVHVALVIHDYYIGIICRRDVPDPVYSYPGSGQPYHSTGPGICHGTIDDTLTVPEKDQDCSHTAEDKDGKRDKDKGSYPYYN